MRLPDVIKKAAAFNLFCNCNRNRLVILTATALALCNAHAQSQFEEDFDDSNKQWQEVALQLPAMPAPEKLMNFYVGPTANQQFMIDAKSIAVGSDGVVRFTLLAVSASGARNLTYEGIRCASLEIKRYALGHADGTWARSRIDTWQAIIDAAANRYAAALAYDYFCQGGMVAGNAQQIVERIKNQRTLRQRLGP